MTINHTKSQKFKKSKIGEPIILCELSNIIIVLINFITRLYILETLF